MSWFHHLSTPSVPYAHDLASLFELDPTTLTSRWVVTTLKGTVSRDFLLLVFLWISLPPAKYPIKTVSNFFENSRRYSQVKVHHRYRGRKSRDTVSLRKVANISKRFQPVQPQVVGCSSIWSWLYFVTNPSLYFSFRILNETSFVIREMLEGDGR